MLKPSYFSILACLLLLLTNAASSQSQPSAPAMQRASSQAQAGNPRAPSQASDVLRVTTRLVLVDVVVLDHKGLPVTDLKAEDFSLQEEGASQKINIFTFQPPAQAEATNSAPKLPPNMTSNVPTYQANRTLNVILLDGLNTDIAAQKLVKQQMIKVLEKLPAGQPVAVYGLSTKLRLLQDFTTDPTLLKQAVAGLKGHSSPVLEGGQPYIDMSVTDALASMGLDNLVAQIQLFQDENTTAQTDARVQITLASLNSLARMLAGYPGRKSLIWLSSAFPGQLLSSSIGMRGNSQGRDYSDEIQRTSNALSNARVAVYPVDARALVNSSVYSASDNPSARGGWATPRTSSDRPGGGEELSKGSDDELARHTTMSSVAEETGGRAFLRTNDLEKAIREGLSDGATYYTLGYYSEDKNWNGKFRRIAVKVERPGTKVRFRQGYFASDPNGYTKIDPKKQATELSQALSMDYPISTALPFRAQVIPPAEKSDGKILIRYAIDAHKLGFELKDGLEYANVDCAVQAFRLKGSPLPLQSNNFAAKLKPEEYKLIMERFFPCSQTLELSPGEYVFRLGVRDNATGFIGTANVRVTVPPKS
jgi:VWFA-related protein